MWHQNGVVFFVLFLVFIMLMKTAKQHRRHAWRTDQRLCRSCGEPHPSVAVFCRRCGQRLP